MKIQFKKKEAAAGANIEDNQQLKGIIKTVTFAGITSVLCVVLSTGSSLLLQKYYRNAIDDSYRVTSELHELSQYMYRYQSIMTDYVYGVNKNEDYLQELEYEQEKITEKLDNIDIMISSINTEHLIENFQGLSDGISDYINSDVQDLSMQLLTSKFKRCMSQYGIVEMYISEYSNSCKEASQSAEKCITLLNIFIMLAVIFSVCISYRHVSIHGKQLQSLKEKADEANKAKSAFLANMSHEIRTPINAVLTMDEMILRENKDNTIDEYAQDIKTAGNTLLSLINDILDVSKIESGKMELVKDNYQLVSIINDIYVMVSEKAKAKGLQFIIKISPDIPSGLYGDSLRIRQIMMNLLNNAVKYTKEGSVTLRLSLQKTNEPEKICLVIKIKDTGIGIKEEDMDKLFAKFERIEEQRNRNIEGTGLGMSIAEQLVDMMQGNIKVNSVYGQGTEFTVIIPQRVVDSTPISRQDMAAIFNRKEYTPTFTAPAARILAVDDNAMNRKGISLLLKKTKMQIDMAASGKECLSLCRKKKYDIVLLDHRMPGMDGIETLGHLRKFLSNTPIIMLTANALSGAKDEYISAGFTDFLSKPVEPEKLEQLIFHYLPKEKIQRENEKKVAFTDIKKISNDSDSNTLVEFSMKDALTKCSTEEIFMEMVSEFVNTYTINRQKIKDSYKAKSEEYRINVHSLKSNARMIGLNLLGTLAEEEEHRVSKELWEYISHAELMAQYENSYQYMKQHYYKQKKADNVKVDNEFVNKKFSILLNSIEAGDLDKIDTIAEELRHYDYLHKKELEEAILLLDYDKIKLLISESFSS